jgi:hypothetical protein
MKIKALLLATMLVFFGSACAQNDDDPTADNDIDSAELEEGSFTLTGVVIEAKAGAEPEGGMPGEENGDGDDADASPEAVEDQEFGGVAVRPDSPDDAEGLDDCETEQDAYVTYYTEDTEFDSGMEDEDDFPESLEGQRVLVSGVIHDVEDEDEAGDADATDDPDADVDADADASVDNEDADADVDADVDAEAEGDDDDENEGDDEGCGILMLDEVEVAPAADTDDDTTDDGSGTVGTADPDATPGATGSPGASVQPGDEKFPPHDDTDPIFEGDPQIDDCEGQKACREEESN